MVSRSAFILILVCQKETSNNAYFAEQRCFENDCFKELWGTVNVDRGNFIPLVYIYIDSKFFLQTVVVRSFALGVTQNTD